MGHAVQMTPFDAASRVALARQSRLIAPASCPNPKTDRAMDKLHSVTTSISMLEKQTKLPPDEIVVMLLSLYMMDRDGRLPEAPSAAGHIYRPALPETRLR